MIDAKVIQKIRDYFAKQTDIVAVYLYGSQVSNKSSRPKNKRDVDIAVLFNHPQHLSHRQFEISARLQNLFLNKTVDCREIYFGDSPVFLMNVLKNGKLIYCGNENKRIAFEVQVMTEYEDTQPLRDLQYFYMQKRLKEGNYDSRRNA